MTSSWVITDTDIRALLGVVDRCQPAADEVDDIFYVDVLSGLRELIPCDDIVLQLTNFGERRGACLWLDDDGVHHDESDGSDGDGWGEWDDFWGENGCSSFLTTSDYSTLHHHAERSRTRAFANSHMASVYAEGGVSDRILLPLGPLEGAYRSLLLWRCGAAPDFTEREKSMLALVRPHVAELHARRVRELRGEPNLTSRQWEVMRQVATGASNTQIARTLGLSDATVRKHLENVFLRLDVQSRTEALARVHAFLDAGAPIDARASA